MHLLSVDDLTEDQIAAIFALADRLNAGSGSATLAGKSMVLFFPDSGIRTRLTFEKGIADLGGTVVRFPSDTLDKREKLEDVVRYIGNWADGLVVRHPDHAKVEEMAAHSSVPVINAMTSSQHPCDFVRFVRDSRKKAGLSGTRLYVRRSRGKYCELLA